MQDATQLTLETVETAIKAEKKAKAPTAKPATKTAQKAEKKAKAPTAKPIAKTIAGTAAQLVQQNVKINNKPVSQPMLSVLCSLGLIEAGGIAEKTARADGGKKTGKAPTIYKIMESATIKIS